MLIAIIRKLLILFSPLVLISNSGSLIPPVNSSELNNSSLTSLGFISPEEDFNASSFATFTISCLPP